MPELAKACRRDMTFCQGATKGLFIWKPGWPAKRDSPELSGDCQEFIVDLVKEAALDYRLNPSLAGACSEEIDTLCHDINPGHGEVMECLKEHYRKIDNAKCRAEIKEALIEERTDIMADPVLHEACSGSVTKHCDGVSHGRGRILQCLMGVLEKGQIEERECRNILKIRKYIWTGFGVPVPESLTDLASVVSSCPRGKYFFIGFSCALAIIFIGGLIYRCLTKRVTSEAKYRQITVHA